MANGCVSFKFHFKVLMCMTFTVHIGGSYMNIPDFLKLKM